MGWQISSASRLNKCKQNKSSKGRNKKRSAQVLQNMHNRTTTISVYSRAVDVNSTNRFSCLDSGENNVIDVNNNNDQ